MDKNNVFWLGLLLTAVGTILYLLTILDVLIADLLDLASVESLTGSVSNSTRFGLGFGSAVMVGWGMTVVVISQYYSQLAKSYLLGAIAVWYILDGIASYITQFYFNILSNTIFLIIGLWAILSTETKK